jgi:hypothetical protein
MAATIERASDLTSGLNADLCGALRRSGGAEMETNASRDHVLTDLAIGRRVPLFVTGTGDGVIPMLTVRIPGLSCNH